ncbi:MAG TPA: YSC84-related protein [Burkholderiales bacterium]|nr:YSC84-related protein [Burkholderiales bacterium]
MTYSAPFRGVIALLLLAAATAHAQSPEEKRAEIRKMRSETLAKLYQAHPKARGAVAGAYGYAVFSNVGINLIFASLAAGRGVAHDNRTKRDVFMKMGSAGVGLGLGLKDFRGVFVFRTRKAFDDFVNDGWEAGAHANAVAKAGKEGGALEGAITVAPGVELYQLTEAGLALEATIQGTKYFKDDELNSAGK